LSRQHARTKEEEADGEEGAMSIAEGLALSGFSIKDGFVSPAQAGELRECAKTRESRGDFSAARIGGGGAEQRLENVRGDLTCWLSEPLLPAEIALLDLLEGLRLELNREAFLGLLDLELHYAKYPPNARYARHVDQPRGTVSRKLSTVLYLNSAWQRADGGELRLYRAGQDFIDIEPLGGRLVCFLTADREHEVLTARRERLSISGWFRGRS
jgi:SM-20-related protein